MTAGVQMPVARSWSTLHSDVRMWKWGYAGNLRDALRDTVCTTRNVHFGVHFANSKWGYAGTLRVALRHTSCTTRTSDFAVSVAVKMWKFPRIFGGFHASARFPPVFLRNVHFPHFREGADFPLSFCEMSKFPDFGRGVHAGNL